MLFQIETSGTHMLLMLLGCLAAFMGLNMNVSDVEHAIWFSGMCCQVSLLVVLLIRRRWRDYPFFTAFVVHQNLVTLILFVVTRLKNVERYRRFYWLSEVSCFLFEVAVTTEMFGILWRRIAQQASIPPSTLIKWSICSLSLAFASAWSVGSPTMPIIDLFAIRGKTFTSLLLCGYFVCISAYAATLRLRRPTSAMIIGWGIAGIALLELCEDFRFFSQGFHRGSDVFDRIEDSLYVVIVFLWTMRMWRTSKPIWVRPLLVAVKQSARG